MKAIKILIAIILTGLLLTATSCGPVSKLRRAEQLIAKAIARGAQVDSSKYVKYDSLKIRSFHDGFTTKLEVNPTFVLNKCQELIKAVPKKQPSIAKQIQKEVCPPVHIDTTYEVSIYTREGMYKLPINVLIDNDGGKFNYSIVGGQLVIPVKTSETKVKISAGASLWDLIIIGIICLVVGYIIRSFRR